MSRRSISGLYAAPEITRLVLEWAWPSAADAIRSWQVWAPAAPDQVWSYCQVRADFNEPAPKVRVLVVFLGPQDDLEPHLGGLTGNVSAKPSRTAKTETYIQSMLALAGCPEWPTDQCRLALQTPQGGVEREAFFAKSDLFKRPLESGAIDTIVRSIEEAREIPGLAHARITFDAFGGAISRLSSEETAFAHRDTLCSAQYLAFWQENAAPQTVQGSMAWLRQFHTSMRPFASGAAYVNYIDPELRDWPQAYYGPGYQRLVEVKARYDPDGVFKLPQGIPAR